jgi:hypothetical protein
MFERMESKAIDSIIDAASERLSEHGIELDDSAKSYLRKWADHHSERVAANEANGWRPEHFQDALVEHVKSSQKATLDQTGGSPFDASGLSKVLPMDCNCPNF